MLFPHVVKEKQETAARRRTATKTTKSMKRRMDKEERLAWYGVE